jgi:hypothetical protein
MNLFTTEEVGEASGNMSNFDLHYNRALDNAIYKHISKGGKSGARVIKILDYHIKYFNDEVIVRRKLVKPKQKIVQVKSYTKIVPKRVKETKTINVKSYIRNSVKVKGYKRVITKEFTIYKEILVSGYSYKKPVGRGYYNNVVEFKGEEFLREGYKRRSVQSLNSELRNINITKNKADFIDRI